MRFSLKDVLRCFNNTVEEDVKKEYSMLIEIPTVDAVISEKIRDLDAKVSRAPNFRYRDFTKSDTALRLGIENVPNEKQWQSIERVASLILQPVRDRFGATRVTSGFRSVPLCIEVGSSRTSNHARGEAVDFEPINPNVKLLEVLSWIHNNLKYRELIAEYFPGGWIHCAYRKGDNSRILKLKDKNHHYKRVSLSYIRNIYR